jgi:hypothetical protein
MTQEELIKNIADTVNAAEKLGPEHKKEFDQILELLTHGSELMLQQEESKALATSIFPLVVMLTFQYLQRFVTENLPYNEALKMFATSIFSSTERKNNVV